jgi:NAD(P)-dependent dehydrogenase (short-subunit alcohol dehydrogenase family)
VTDLRFDGKVAIVTGAGNGLGKHHALLLAARGARVVVNDIGGSIAGNGRDSGPAEAVAQEIRDRGGEAVVDTNTVATQAGGEAIVRTALGAYGRVDVRDHLAEIRDEAGYTTPAGPGEEIAALLRIIAAESMPPTR